MNSTISFPILPDRDILEYMKQLNIPFEVQDLIQPVSAKVVSVFVKLMNAGSGIPLDEISVYDRENAKKYNLDGNQHLLSVISAFNPLCDFMNNCRIHDFCYSDLLQPTPERFREQLSAAINFLLFSDSFLAKLEPYRNKSIQLKECIRNAEYNLQVTQTRKEALEMQKQKDSKMVFSQKENNSKLVKEVERLNIEQQHLKEMDNAIKVQIAEVTRTINQLEQQIVDENQTTLELGEKIVVSPRKLKQDIADMTESYARLTTECRSLNIQSTDLKAQCQIVKQAVNKLSSIIDQLQSAKNLLTNREELNTQLENIKDRIRELKKLNEDQAIEEKKYELQLKRQEEEVEELRRKVVINTNSTKELMGTLSEEYSHLQATLESVEKEEKELEVQLLAMQTNREDTVEVYNQRMQTRIELMHQLIDRVHTYQDVMMQAFPK